MFISTRNPQNLQSLSQAIKAGLASDGGLFVPQQMPLINHKLFPDLSFNAFACEALKPFFSGDSLNESLASICHQAFDFPLPLKQLDANTFVLELFHGPTSSFKDFGARFLALCLDAQPDSQRLIVVATSGDTGSAVAAAFHRKVNNRVIILYPDGKVSARQEHQLSCWDENVFSFAVDGNFDQCQQLVKSAFEDPDWQGLELSSANSINLGRLLPQLSYYAYSALTFYRQHGKQPGFIIPSGNFGNATAAYWAKAMGFPIREIVMATNANRVLVDYLHHGNYQSRPSIATLANAMDVGNPSNMERLIQLFGSPTNFRQNVQAFSIGDEEIIASIRQSYQHYGYLSCPHTATAFCARGFLSREEPWIVVATADPSKFDELVEPIVNNKVPVAPQLQRLLDRPNRTQKIKPSLAAIKEALTK